MVDAPLLSLPFTALPAFTAFPCTPPPPPTPLVPPVAVAVAAERLDPSFDLLGTNLDNRWQQMYDLVKSLLDADVRMAGAGGGRVGGGRPGRLGPRPADAWSH